MVRYKAFFINKHISVKAEVLNYYSDPVSEYGLILTMNEVNIDLGGFEELLIEDAEQYREQQLKIFEYEEVVHLCKDKQKNFLLLKNFHLEVIIPIQVVEKNSNKIQTADLHVHVHCDGTRLYKYQFKILNTTSELPDITDALQDIQNQLKDTFVLEICAVCKNSSWNPYGGVPFFNHLCFRANKELFWTVENKNKSTIGSFMNEAKWEFTYLTYRCEEFLPY